MNFTLINGIGLTLLSFATAGCFARVDVEDDGSNRATSSSTGVGSGGVQGLSCDYLAGEATLESYDGDNYGASAFSFEFASQDPELTGNEFNLLYDNNRFRVNLVTDDVSFIVDLGDILLTDVPELVDLSDYPRGAHGEHDSIDAVFDHTYYVRSADSSGRNVAALRVVGLEPGSRVTVRWARSTDPDRMVLPVGCGL